MKAERAAYARPNVYAKHADAQMDGDGTRFFACGGACGAELLQAFPRGHGVEKQGAECGRARS